MLKPALAIAMIGFVAIAASRPVLAQGVQAPQISIEQATKIARDAGLTMIREIELDDGKWEVDDAIAADGKKYDVDLSTDYKIIKQKLDND